MPPRDPHYLTTSSAGVPQQKTGTDGVPVFDSTIILVRQLRDFGIGVALYSSSRNCADVLIAAGMADLFDVRVDGVLAEELGLARKPDSAMLVEASKSTDCPAGPLCRHRGRRGPG